MEFEGAIELLFELSTEVVIDVDAWRRVKNVIISGSFRVFEDLGKEFSRKAEASVMKRDMAVTAHRLRT